MPTESSKIALVIVSDHQVFDLIREQLALFGWSAVQVAALAPALELLCANKWPLIFFGDFGDNESDIADMSVHHHLDRLQPNALLFMLTHQLSVSYSDSPVRKLYKLVPLRTGNTAFVRGQLHHFISTALKRLAEAEDALTFPLPDIQASPIIGCCQAIVEVRRQINESAGTSLPVLLTGERNTGKMLVAHTIHNLRCGDDDVPVLLNWQNESEDFGGPLHGQLPELWRGKKRGTILLLDVNHASEETQATLLRHQCGVDQPMRLIASSPCDLRSLMEQGRFSAALYRQLQQKHHIHLPPLRERREDIKLLIPYFVRKPYVHISVRAWAAISDYPWPGNLAELQSVAVSTAAAAAGVICLDDLSGRIRKDLTAQTATY
ncbi:MAG: sigma 54-interacting transcriptional regulator [Pyrinomonadaceae bacterium]